MTTIAFDGRYLACDMLGNNGSLYEVVRKMRIGKLSQQAKDKYGLSYSLCVLASTGTLNEIEALRDFLFCRDKPVPTILDPQYTLGLLWHVESETLYKISGTLVLVEQSKSCIAVDGSGSDMATALMHAGLSAPKAIWHISQVSSNAGYGISCFDTHTTNSLPVHQKWLYSECRPKITTDEFVDLYGDSV